MGTAGSVSQTDIFSQTGNGWWFNRRQVNQTVFLGILCHLLKLTLWFRIGGMGFVLCLHVAAFFRRCVYLSLWVFGSFVADLQGLWTEAHQCDRAPQWQLPSAAGPWPVPRCLRRWSSLSARCFLCTALALNTPAIQWTDPQFFGCGPRPSRPSVCVHGPQLYREIALIFLFSPVGLLWLSPCDSQPLHSFRFCIHSDRSAFKTKKTPLKEKLKWIMSVFFCVIQQLLNNVPFKCIADLGTGTRIAL